MSRYIDYDAIDYRNDKLHDKSEDFLNGVYYMAERIEDAPSIEIVRCKECRHREKYVCDEIEFYECGHIRYKGTKCGVTDDWFCADGERRMKSFNDTHLKLEIDNGLKGTDNG